MDILNAEIPYDSVNQILEAEKKRCEEWLKKALQVRQEGKALSAYDMLSRELRQYNGSQNETNEKQWRQLEDHRLRLDGVDAALVSLAERAGILEQASSAQDEANAKQWQQLEDHRLRLDGVDATLTSQRERIEILEHSNESLREVNEKQCQQLTELKQIVDMQQQAIEVLTQCSEERHTKLQERLDSTNEHLSMLMQKSIRFQISNFFKKLFEKKHDPE